MATVKKILFVTETRDLGTKLLMPVVRRLVKGFIRLGHDTQIFSWNHAWVTINPISQMRLTRRWRHQHTKKRINAQLANQIKRYDPQIICITFPKSLDGKTIDVIRQVAPKAFLLGIDVDLWPQTRPNRFQAAGKLDMVLTTFDPAAIQMYHQTGINAVFMPNPCDPDIEYRYDVDERFRSDILFTGQNYKQRYPADELRNEILLRLEKMPNAVIYGCCGRPIIGGIDYYRAISGAKIGLSINANNDIRLYHSDRLTHYMACGTFVLAKRVPDSEILFQDGKHLRYFDTADEFFELADYYLSHEPQRRQIADEGMKFMHAEFNCTKIVRYTMELIETGKYSAWWETSQAACNIKNATALIAGNR